MCCKTAKHKLLNDAVQRQGFVPAGLGFDPAAPFLCTSFEQLSQPAGSTCFYFLLCSLRRHLLHVHDRRTLHA